MARAINKTPRVTELNTTLSIQHERLPGESSPMLSFTVQMAEYATRIPTATTRIRRKIGNTDEQYS